MTLPTSSSRVTALGNGVTTVWPYTFKIPDEDSLVVEVITNATGVAAGLSSSQYSVTGIGNNAGGSVTYPLSGTPLSSSFSLRIRREVDYIQETDIVNQSGFYPEVIEAALDYIVMQVQQLNDELQSITVDIGAALDLDARVTVLEGVAFGTGGDRILELFPAFYVNGTTGNDNNNGRSPGAAFATLKGAYDHIANNYDCQGTDAELNIADGTYDGFAADRPFVGIRFFYINGNLLNASAVVVNQIAGGDDCIAGRDPTNHIVTYGISFFSDASNGDCIHCSHGQIHISGNCRFLFATKNFFDADTNGTILISGNNEIVGDAENLFAPTEGGTMAVHGTITLTGVPDFSGSTALCADTSHLNCDATFIGTATGQRFRCIRSSNILTNPGTTTYFPGNVVGFCDRSSSYNSVPGNEFEVTDTDTTAFNNAIQEGAIFQNKSATNNNWITFPVLASDDVVAGGMAIQITSHASHYATWGWYTRDAGGFARRLHIGSGVQIGAAPTGGDKGVGTLNLSGDVYKNNTAYTNPDYVFEYEYTGAIVQFAENEGAVGYEGRIPLNELKKYTKENLRLPGISDAPLGLFERGDIALAKLEEAYLYIIELHERLKALEEKTDE